MADEGISVSVIVPVYNTEPYIRECLDSILGQRLDSIEVLCVDDGSTDESPSIVAAYAEKDPRVRVVGQRPGGKGPGIARNTAIKAARGEFIAFVDSDDKIHATMLQQLYRAAKDHDADIAMCTIELFSAQGEKGKYAACSYDRFLPAGIERQTFSWQDFIDGFFGVRFVAWNKLYNRKFLLDHGISFSEGIFFEDLSFTFPAMLKANRMRLVRKPLYFNRRERKGSTTFEQGPRVFDAITAMAEFESFLQSDKLYEPMQERFEAFRFEKLYGYLHKNDTAHLEKFFVHLKEYAGSPGLDDNPHLRKSFAQKRDLIREKDFLDFLVYELWDARVKNASLARQRRRLQQLLGPAIKMKRLARGAVRRLRRVGGGRTRSFEAVDGPTDEAR